MPRDAASPRPSPGMTADAMGQILPPAGREARIASLVPSLTETLFALGLGAQVVARTGFCLHPRDGVAAVPKVGGTKDVRLDALRALRPSHVLVNVDENTRETVAALRRFIPHVVVTHPQEPEDNLVLFNLLGELFGDAEGVPQAAAALGSRLRGVLSTIADAGQRRATVLYPVWRRPWITVARDTYISRCLARVGWDTLPDVRGGNGLDRDGSSRYPQFDWDAPWLDTVDCVLLPDEPYRFDAAHAAEVRDRLAARGRAVEVHRIPGDWASWYGVRAIDGLTQLAVARQRARAGAPANGR